MELKQSKLIHRARLPIFIVMLLSLTFSLPASAWDVKVNGIAYTVKNDNSGQYAEVVYDALYEDLTEANIVPEVTYQGTTYPVAQIAPRAFSDCANIKKATIPTTITTMGDGAFENCSSLNIVNWNVISITNYANYACYNVFAGCSSLSKVVFGQDVKRIPKNLLYNVSSLSTIVFPSELREIGSNAFEGTAWFNNQPEGLVYAGPVAYKYKGTAPANINIYNGTLGIADGCFDENGNYTVKNIINVVLPPSVTHIGGSSFEECYNLQSINLEHVQYIGGSAFWSCRKLTQVNIGTSTSSNTDIVVGGYAFYGCSELVNVKIGERGMEIGNHAFKECVKLKNISLPSTIKTIGKSAFYKCTSLEQLSLPDSLTSIGEDAFYNCTSLSGNLRLPEKLSSIGDYAFYGCNFTSLTYEAENCKFATSGGSWLGADIPRKNAFDSGKITQVTIGSKVKVIPYGFWAFKLKSIVIPEWIESVQSGAFESNTYLQSVTWLPKNCTTGYAPFYGCENLTTFTFPDEIEEIPYGILANVRHLENIEIPNTVTSIGNRAFEDCISLQNITIPTSVKTIGSLAFHGCASLANVTIPEQVTSLGDEAFSSCSMLTSVYFNAIECEVFYKDGYNYTIYGPFIETQLENFVLGNKVKTIPRSLLKDCTLLTSVTIPNSVTTIGSDAFSGCSGLTSVAIPNSVTTIGYYAFRGCTGLTSVTIPSSVTTIGHHAFGGCSGLTGLTIGNSVTSIGDYAFGGCTSLTSVTNYALTPQNIYSSTFYNVNVQNCHLYVPGGSIDKYKSTTYWNRFIIEEIAGDYDGKPFSDNSLAYTIMSLDNHTASITGPADGSQLAENLVIPSTVEYNGSTYTVTEIANSAFENNQIITSVVLPGTITRIGHRAFDFCSKLKSVNFPEGLSEIGDFSLASTWINTAHLPASLEKLGDFAFDDTHNLASFTVAPNSKHFAAIDGVLFDKDVKTMCGYPTKKTTAHYITPATCEKIPNTFNIDSHNLITFTLGKNVNEFYGGVIDMLGHMEGIYVDAANTHFKSIDGVLYTIDGKTLKCFAKMHQKEYRIPDGVTTIASGAFMLLENLEHLTLPASITSIEYYQNFWSDNLTIHCGMTSLFDLPDYAFLHRESQYNLKVPKGMLATYRAHPVWGRFKTIEEEETLGVESIASDTPSFSISGTTISVESSGDVHVEVYDMSGRLIYSGASRMVEVPGHGYYIIKANGNTTKVKI